MTESFNINTCHDSRNTAILPSKWQQSETKYEPVIYMCKETAENGGLAKENRCVHVSQVNYNKPSDCNKLYLTQIQQIFSFLKLFKQKLNC